MEERNSDLIICKTHEQSDSTTFATRFFVILDFTWTIVTLYLMDNHCLFTWFYHVYGAVSTHNCNKNSSLPYIYQLKTNDRQFRYDIFMYSTKYQTNKSSFCIGVLSVNLGSVLIMYLQDQIAGTPSGPAAFPFFSRDTIWTCCLLIFQQADSFKIQLPCLH